MLDKLLARVMEEAEKQSQQILSAAREEAARLLQKKQEEIEEEFRHRLHQEKELLAERYRERLARLKLSGQQEILREKNRCLGEVLEEVKTLFLSWMEEKGPEYLGKLLRQLKGKEESYTVYVPAGKESRYAVSLPAGVKLVGQSGLNDGFLVAGPDFNLSLNWERVKDHFYQDLIEVFRRSGI
ncbi:MAG TPA: hypothetical protein PKX93_04810 [bacterium]|nr:hypothetical protein [bacterium]HOL66763.1 hypothetical protein [bacterium]HPP12563.1 hypothetical protein [bacterium]